MNDDCPICYQEKINCKLTCGHSFCKRCIILWYSESVNGMSSCPICRKQIVFKGIHKLKKYILHHKKNNVIQNVFEKYLEIILNQITIFSMIYIKYISLQLYKLSTYKQTFTEDEINILLYFNFPEYKQPNIYEYVTKNKKIIDNVHYKRKFYSFKNMFYIQYK